MTLMSFFEECLNIHYLIFREELFPKCLILMLSLFLSIIIIILNMQSCISYLSPFHGNGNYIPCMFKNVFLGCLVWVSSQCFGWLIFCCCQVGSRLVLQTTGLLMIILGLFGKFSAVFITIPDPVIGGMFLVMFGMVAAVGISNLQVHLIAVIHFYFIFHFIILKLHVRVTSSK